MSFEGLDVIENLQTHSYTVKEEPTVTIDPKVFFKRLEESNRKATAAGWVNPKNIPPIRYDEKRKCRIVTRLVKWIKN